MLRVLPLFATLILLTSAPAFAQKKGEQAPSRADLQKTMKPADGFTSTVFAMPPDVSYPTCLEATPGGDVYVGVDLNGSLGRTKGQGKVVRCRDTDNDGTADEFVTFCEVQHPRGLHFTHGKLIVLHPPFLSAFIDDNGDGKSDRQEILVKGLSTDATNQRGADHTTNGFRLGIDGWLYIAVGDFGFVKAEGKDGKTVQLYGGGVARVRPDGTELEVVSRGQRNIYDVAVSPTLDLFTRDNTNDGDGWDVRLSHVVPLGHYGYPSLYKNFPTEHIQPLNDFGGGSPCGALYLSEPGFPEGFGDSLYTVEWGRSAVFRHPLTKKGAGYNKSSQTPLINLPSPTDMDVDGSGRLYIASWRGGGFSFSNPYVGFVARLTPPGWKYVPFPDLAKMSPPQLVRAIDSPSAVMRQAAQLEILSMARKAPKDGPIAATWIEPLVALMNDTSKSIPVRVAALFTLKQLAGAAAIAPIEALTSDDNMREFAIRALADRTSELTDAAAQKIARSLTDANPRVRLQATIALARNNKSFASPAIVPLTSDPDPVLAHVAVQALIRLKASEACLQSLDKGQHALGCLRVLQGLHDPAVVDALITRSRQTPTSETAASLLPALCRLHFKEHEWDGKWWGTRPDTAGPYFKRVPWSETAKIAEELSRNLKTAEGPTLKTLLVEMKKHKIDVPGLDVALLKLANDDPAFRPQALELLLAGSTFPAEALAILRQAAADPASPLRAKAVRGLHRSMDQKDFFPAAVDAFAALTSKELGNKEFLSAWDDFTRDAKHATRIDAFAKLAQSKNPAERDLGWAVLVSLATGKLTPPAPRQAAERVIDSAWNTESAVPLLTAIAKTKADAFAYQVRNAIKSENPAVKKSAEAAFKSLGLDKADSSGPRIELKGKAYETVHADAMKLPGDAKVGQAVFLKQGCIACHTVSPMEPVKGPYLGDIAARYKRPDLLESILKPSAKISQGFETTFFALTSGKTVEGFVVRESGDEVELRTSAGVSMLLKKSDIDERGRREISVMPTGLADNLTVSELASLVAYLERLNTKK